MLLCLAVLGIFVGLLLWLTTAPVFGFQAKDEVTAGGEAGAFDCNDGFGDWQMRPVAGKKRRVAQVERCQEGVLLREDGQGLCGWWPCCPRLRLQWARGRLGPGSACQVLRPGAQGGAAC